MRTKTPMIVGLLTLGVLGGVALFLHRNNAELRVQARALRSRNAPQSRLIDENRRMRELLDRAGTDAVAATQAVRQEVQRLRAEVRALEESARAAAAEKAAVAVALVANRDPEKALAPLENFQNVGRSTPAAVVQTIVWAALKADEATLVASMALTDDARERAGRLLARLPESSRAKYPTVESLAALVVTGEILRADAAQVLATSFVDARHAFVGVRFAGVDGDERVVTELGPDGWKVTVPKKMITGLEKRLNPTAPPPARKE